MSPHSSTLAFGDVEGAAAELPADQLDRRVGNAMRRVLTARYSEADAIRFLTELTAATLFGTSERRAQDRAYELLSSRLIKAGAPQE